MQDLGKRPIFSSSNDLQVPNLSKFMDPMYLFPRSVICASQMIPAEVQCLQWDTNSYLLFAGTSVGRLCCWDMRYVSKFCLRKF